MHAKDGRLNLLNEMLAGMKIIKLYAWEPSFVRNLLQKRETELHYIKYANLIMAITNIGWFLCPLFVSIVSCTGYV